MNTFVPIETDQIALVLLTFVTKCSIVYLGLKVFWRTLAMINLDAMSSVGIIYPASRPSTVFGEIKDNGYSHVEFRNHFFLVGGNAFDEDSTADTSPLSVFLREVREELYLLPTQVHDSLVEAARPYQDYYFEIPADCFRRANPQSKKGDRRELASVSTVPLSDREWGKLEQLQNKYGNLSNESGSCITMLETVLEGKPLVSWMVGHILKNFWLMHGCLGAAHLPLYDGVTCEMLGTPRNSLNDYANEYCVVRK
jgi:hypothetical protein